MTEEEAYNIAMQELQSGLVSDGIWAKAIAFSEGDETKAKANYLRFRAEQIITEQLSHATLAFRYGILALLLSPSGKMPRSLFSIVLVITVFLFMISAQLIDWASNENKPVITFILAPIYITAAWSLLSAHLKRARDMGVSPFLILAYLSPWLVPFALVGFLFTPTGKFD